MSSRVCAALIAVLVVACDLAGGGGVAECPSVTSLGPQPEPRYGEALGWRSISACAGGTVEVPGGARLEIPPGALARDTLITVRVLGPGDTPRHYLLEPEGIAFASPVVLDFPFLLTEREGEAWVAIFQSSALNPIRSTGSEETNWAPADLLGYDAGRVRIGLDHFTGTYAFQLLDRPAYIVFDIPPAHLRPGDVLVTLTHVEEEVLPGISADGPNWMPGHIGMLYSAPPSGGGRAQVCESTPSWVRLSDYEGFKTDHDHLYLGPRRPPGEVLTDTERLSFVNLCGTLATGADGRRHPYSPVGAGVTDVDSFSCVGLVEHCLDSVDRGVISLPATVTGATPLEMFWGTEPIRDVQIRVGQSLEVPVYGVVVDPASGAVIGPRSPVDGPGASLIGPGWYTRYDDYAIEPLLLPRGATFEGSGAEGGYIFRFTPSMEMAGQSIGVPFRLHYPFFAPVGGPVDATFTVTVTGNFAESTLSPLGPRGFAVTEHYFLLPEGAVVHGTVFIDAETGEAPTPFTGHTLEVQHEGFRPDREGYYGITFVLRNLTADVVDEPPKTIQYFVDWSIPYWRNDG